MSSGRRKTAPGSDPDPDAAADGADELLSSEDLFGDIVDEPPSRVPKAGTKRSRKDPIRVRLPESGQPGVASPAAPLPEDVAALLDAIPDAEPAQAPAHGRGEAEEGSTALDHLLEAPTPPAPATEAPASVERALEEEEVDLDELFSPDAAAAPTPKGRAEAAEPNASVRVEALATPAPEARREQADPDLEGLLRAASRHEVEFAASEPAPSSPDNEGLSLAALAEDALTPASDRAEAQATSEVLAPRDEPIVYGPYQLLERVARGGMAEVFRAKRSGIEGFEKILAVKRILAHLSDNKEFVDMFVNEAKLVAGLTHTNIVQILDLGRLETSYYIAMEYVHGRDLRTIQKRSMERELPIPIDLCAYVVSNVCAALEYAHRKKDEAGRPLEIVHRDISPQNILISFEGAVKLTDFGIAKAAAKASTTDKGTLRGKLLFMSPEQAWGRPMDRRADVFSLGIVFYELLAGEKPFVGAGEMSVLEVVRQSELRPLRSLKPELPEALEQVVMKALEREPDDRYQDAGDMHRDLEQMLNETQAHLASELMRYLELLFDPEERGELAPEEVASGDDWVASGLLELDFDSVGSTGEDRTAPGVPRDPMSIQRLLKRFKSK
jgi:serine/threonine protein kinase